MEQKQHKVTLIVAMNEEGVIGKEGKLPWNCPADLKHFKERTMGKGIIMGRKTRESIGRALPGRKNYVLSRDKSYTLDDGSVVVNSIFEIVDIILAADDDLYVIGGEEIYELLIHACTHMTVTTILDYPVANADAFIDTHKLTSFTVESTERHVCPTSNIKYTITEYVKTPRFATVDDE